MAETGAQEIIRRRRRRMSRWMQAEKRQRLTERLALVLSRSWQGLPGFFLSFAEIMSIPSGFHVAYLVALASMGLPVSWPVAGALVGLVMRMVWGLPWHLETLVTLLAILPASSVLHRRGNPAMMLYAGLSLTPSMIVAITLGGTAAVVIQAAACMALSALSAPVFYRAVNALRRGRAMDSVEERVAVGYLGALMLCGGGRMLLLGMNVGVLGAAAVTLLTAMYLGVGAGCIGGMVGGVVLALHGLPLTLSVSLAMGGFLAGMAQMMGRRYITCLCFAAGCVTAMILSGASGAGSAVSAVIAPLAVMLLPRRTMEGLQTFFRRFLSSHPTAGDAYAASALAAWEKTVAAMAAAVPSPVEETEQRDAAWWEERLCARCPEDRHCGCMLAPEAREKAEFVWQSRDASDEIWLDALENLRGLGCGRLYCLREAITAMRDEDAIQRRQLTKACYQRDMLVTHLMAMAGAARRYAMLSTGDNWWDDMSARRLRKALSELAYPASLMYVRRVQGHARAAYSLRYVTGAKKQAEELCELTAKALDAPMRVVECDDDRVVLTEKPLLSVEQGIAAQGCEHGCNGDTAWVGELQDGRWLAALSDGMGHGEQAARESEQTVELLRLCLDAGYTRSQTLTAVNGMMLLAGRGERFSTVDLVTLDLWSGQATLDKLGAAASWIAQGNALTCVTGDALPLGILETVDSRSSVVRLHGEDEVVLMTDGVEDAFPSRVALENAIRAALTKRSAKEAAEALLDSAIRAAGEQTRVDDRTVVVLRVSAT
ncbi:MAG: SpoIIE family protein phosphatase [Christensenellaceae bacterium]|nr:SpoIIE family protein phosphatase [Christensenellaceae bacterium]